MLEATIALSKSVPRDRLSAGFSVCGDRRELADRQRAARGSPARCLTFGADVCVRQLSLHWSRSRIVRKVRLSSRLRTRSWPVGRDMSGANMAALSDRAAAASGLSSRALALPRVGRSRMAAAGVCELNRVYFVLGDIASGVVAIFGFKFPERMQRTTVPAIGMCARWIQEHAWAPRTLHPGFPSLLRLAPRRTCSPRYMA